LSINNQKSTIKNYSPTTTTEHAAPDHVGTAASAVQHNAEGEREWHKPNPKP
jgi:hypothetical protein